MVKLWVLLAGELLSRSMMDLGFCILRLSQLVVVVAPIGVQLPSPRAILALWQLVAEQDLGAASGT